MPLMPTDIVDEVRDVLINAHTGKGTEPHFLTAYQILERLPAAMRNQLITERTAGGASAGVTFGAPSVVSQAARQAGAEVEYMDSVGLSAEIAGQAITPSYEVCGLYRLRAGDENIV